MSASTDLRTESTTTASSDSLVLLFARIAITPLYLYSGVGKVMAFCATAGRLNGWLDGFGSAIAVGAIAVELGGGVGHLMALVGNQAAVEVDSVVLAEA